MGGVIIGYEIGRLLKKETIFCERINGKFVLRRGFYIKKKVKSFNYRRCYNNRQIKLRVCKINY